VITREEASMKKDVFESIMKLVPKGQTHFSLEQLNQLMLDKKLPKGVYTLNDIGDLCGLTRERIRQIEFGAIKKLKNILSNPKFRQTRDYLKDHISGECADQQNVTDIEHMFQEMRTALRINNVNM
jgi:DNA-directed RNA polymerase sigma subunit (sigma70/sigma32)